MTSDISSDVEYDLSYDEKYDEDFTLFKKACLIGDVKMVKNLLPKIPLGKIPKGARRACYSSQTEVIMAIIEYMENLKDDYDDIYLIIGYILEYASKYNKTKLIKSVILKTDVILNKPYDNTRSYFKPNGMFRLVINTPDMIQYIICNIPKDLTGALLNEDVPYAYLHRDQAKKLMQIRNERQIDVKTKLLSCTDLATDVINCVIDYIDFT